MATKKTVKENAPKTIKKGFPRKSSSNDLPEFVQLIRRIQEIANDAENFSERISALEKHVGRMDDHFDSTRKIIRDRISRDDEKHTRKDKKHIEQIEYLTCELDNLKRRTYKDRFLLQSGMLPNQTHLEFPVRIYLSNTEGAAETIHNISNLVNELGAEFIEDYQIEYGSVFKEWFARTFNRQTKEELRRRLRKAEKALEIQKASLPQSEATKNHSESISNLTGVLKDQDAAVIQIESLLYVKHKNPDGTSQVLCKTLTLNEQIALEDNPQWIREPHDILNNLRINNEEEIIKLKQIK